MSDLITISSSVLPHSARVLGFRGTERISRPYHIEIFLLLPHEIGEEFDLADAIGAKARMVIDRPDIGFVPHVFAGVFANVEVLQAFEGQVLLRAHLVPRLWQLGLSRHSRMFTKMRIPDIISSVLEENGVTDVELRLGSYDVEDHVCQYRESDLDFIARWMEREGIYYYFEHTDDGEKLILADNKGYDEDPLHKPVRYFPQGGQDHSAGAHFRSFRCVQATLPTGVRLKDYDYAKPNLPIVGRADVQSNGAGEVSLYGERLFTPSLAERYATVRAEELLAKQAIFHGGGTRLHIRPGYTFELDEHPFPSFNAKYLAVEVRHSGNQAIGSAEFRELMQIEHTDVYRVEVEAVSAKLQYRAESLVPWPRIYGYENGTVDGPADSEYAQIDEMGRYNAKFKFDESSLKNGKATCWVRMMQPHGGSVEGFHFPLRKGTEVVFCFLGGDCDRPVIFGIVPNAVKPSPVTSVNHTRNVIQTGSYNRVEMEDLEGGQWMHLSTPPQGTHFFMGAIGECDHNFVLETQGTGHLHTHGKWDVNVEGTLNETVVGNVTEIYESNTVQKVSGNKTHTITGLQTETIHAGRVQTIDSHNTRTINGPYKGTHNGVHTQTHTGAHTHTHTGAHTHTHTGALVRTRTGTTTETLDGDVSRTVKGNVDEKVSANVDWNIGGNVDINCVEWKVNTSGNRIFGISGSSFEHKLSISAEFVGGLKSEVFAGAKNEIMIGFQNEMTIGAHNEGSAGPHSEYCPLHQKESGITEETHGMFMLTAGDFVATSGNIAFDAGLFFCTVGLTTFE